MRTSILLEINNRLGAGSFFELDDFDVKTKEQKDTDPILSIVYRADERFAFHARIPSVKDSEGFVFAATVRPGELTNPRIRLSLGHPAY